MGTGHKNMQFYSRKLHFSSFKKIYFDLLDFHQLLVYSWPLLTKLQPSAIYYQYFIIKHVDEEKFKESKGGLLHWSKRGFLSELYNIIHWTWATKVAWLLNGPEDETVWVSFMNQCWGTWWSSGLHCRASEWNPNNTSVIPLESGFTWAYGRD